MSDRSSSATDAFETLSQASGVGPSTLDSFSESRFTSARDVGTHTPSEIAAEVSGVGYSTAVSILTCLDENGLRNEGVRDRDLERLVSLLRDLFEFDKADLDFGVYKLMNANREQIDAYIEDELVGKIESSVSELYDEFGTQDEGDVKTSVIKDLGSEVALDGDSLSDRALVEIEDRTSGMDTDELENARSDIYNHVYQFLSTYYDSGDFITRRKRTHHSAPYSVPYDGSNTNFHWVTKNQHYAKTSEHLTRFKFSLNDHDVAFETVAAELEGSGIGNSEYFLMSPPSEVEVARDETDRKIVRVPFYRRMIDEDDLEQFDDISAGSHNKQSTMNEAFAVDIQEEASNHDVHLDREDLQTKIDEYTTRNQNDFFIHEDIEGFLTGELEEYVKTEIVSFDPADGLGGMSDLAVEKGRIVNEITTDIISFVSQLEDFKRKLFEKKKFVTDSYQLIQLTNVPAEQYGTILDNEAQLADWESSFGIDGSSLTPGDLGEFPHNQMMVNTGYFDSELRSESEPQNKLIHGDNYQAQAFLSEKYGDEVKCIYIDPPYNTGNANFAYKDNYQRPTWLSMMYDRIEMSRELLQEDGVIFVSIDYREVHTLRSIMNEIYGEANHLGSFVWKRRITDSRSSDNLSIDHEYVLAYGRTDKAKLRGRERDYANYTSIGDEEPWLSRPITNPKDKHERPNLYYTIVDPKTGNEFTDVWRYSEESMAPLIRDGKVKFPDNPDGTPRRKLYKSEVKDDYKTVSSWIEDSASDVDVDNIADLYSREIMETMRNEEGTNSLKKLFGSKAYDFPKPPSLIKQLIQWTVEDDDTVLDFFAGSGTTAQVVQELNRERDEQVNYVMVEMLDKAFDITEERVKRTAYTDQWNEGRPAVDPEDNAPAFNSSVECIELESYEDALDAVEFDDTQQTLGAFNTTMLRYLLEFGTKNSPVFLDADQLKTPLEYELNGDVHSQAVDVMTTFNYLIGLEDIKRTREDGYTIYEGQVNESHTQVIWRHDADSVDYKAEAEMFNTTAYDRIYINGDSTLKNTEPIAPVFEKKMLGGTDTLQ